MALPSIILPRPYILVTIIGDVSSSGIQLQEGFGFQFGNVEMVFQTCDVVAVADTILFKPTEWVKIIYGSTIYYLGTIESAQTFTDGPPL